MVEAWSTLFGLVIEKIDFFGLVIEKIDFCWSWSLKKSTFLGLVSEKIDFFEVGQRKNRLF